MKKLVGFMKIMKEDLYRYKWKYLTILLLSLVSIVPNMVGPTITAKVLAGAVKGNLDTGFMKTILGLGLLYIISCCLTYARKKLTNNAGFGLIGCTRKKITNKIQELDIDELNNSSSQSIMTVFVSDTNELRELFGHIVPDFIRLTLTSIGVGYILFKKSWELAMVAIIPGPLIFLACYVITKKVTPLIKKNREEFRKQNDLASEILHGIREVHVFNKEQTSKESINELTDKHIQACYKSRHYGSMFNPVCVCLFYLGDIITMLVGIYLVSQGKMDGETLTAFILYLPSFYDPFGAFVDMYDCLQSAMACIGNIYDLLSKESTIMDGNIDTTPENTDIVFDNVTFSYEDNKVVDKVSFTVEPNKMVAIVGPTGAGKSTIIKLLERFYDVDTGSITVGGVDVKDMTRRALRSVVTPVMQETHLFNDTVSRNIAFSVEKCSMEQIIEAAKMANIHDDIMKMPNGYDTIIGEKGVKLSGGQRQRIAIARAFLRNTPVIILDEATSAVDNETEKQIQKAISNLSGQRSVIAIAHRLSTIEQADEILFIEDGKIVEQGSHKELMASKGKYFRMQSVS